MMGTNLESCFYTDFDWKEIYMEYSGGSAFYFRFLSDDELKAVIGILHPSERYYAKQQVDYVLSQVWVH